MQSILQDRRFKHAARQYASQDTEKGDSHASVSSENETMESMGIRSDRSEEKGGRLIVSFAEHDYDDPKQWSYSYRWLITIIVGTAGFLVGWGSSTDSAIIPQASKAFNVSVVAESLATSLYLIGFGFGAIFSGPLSETFGRNPVYLVTLGLYAAWILGAALAPNFGAQLVFRLLAGACGATPLTTFGGSVADLWEPLERTYVFPVMACMSFLGPFLAPMVTAFIGQNDVTWRWAEWTTLIMTGLVFCGIALLVPETHASNILDWKAAALRKATGDDRYVSEMSLKSESLLTKMKVSMTRPFMMLVLEPIVLAFTLYLSVIYIILFTFLTGYDFIFGPMGIYGLSQGSEGLMFLGLNVGFMVALAFCPYIYFKYKKAHKAAMERNEAVAPEQRLWYAMISAPWCPISLFWMAWTAYPSISYWSPLIASVAFGFVMQGIFITSYQYLIDTYEAYAASALVSLTFFRYVLAGIMVTVSEPMYTNIGVHWTLTLLGCISLLLTPVPSMHLLQDIAFEGISRAADPDALRTAWTNGVGL